MRVLPLYGELGAAAQDAALGAAPAGRRKIVLATSIAETSLTIEGIRVVVDSGLRRYAKFDPADGHEPARDREGLAGRSRSAARPSRPTERGCLLPAVVRGRAGVARARRPPPEILHADLAPLALELSCWGAVEASRACAGSTRRPPRPLAQARDLLRLLEAIDAAVSHHAARPRARGDRARTRGSRTCSSRARELGVPRLACDLAAILSERDVLRAAPGSRDVDLRLRVSALRGNVRSLPPGLERRLARSAAGRANLGELAARIRRRRGRTRPIRTTSPACSSRWPIRIASPARATPTGDTCSRMVGARASPSPRHSPSPSSSWRRNSTAREREARIFLAAPVQLDDLERHFAAQIYRAHRDRVG